jgi:hypothetical protein
MQTLVTDKHEARFAYLAPYHAQAKDIAWTYLQRFSSVIPGVSYNVSELRVDFPNGARIRLYGAENADRMRGLYFDGIVIDEPADINPRVWPEVVRPALSDRQGWATFIGTPKGHNAFYEIYRKADNDNEWTRLLLRASETGLLPEHELAAARRDLSVDQFNQEYECSFEAAVVGSYFGREIGELETKGQIKELPHDQRMPVDVFFDLGFDDATAMWFIQRDPYGVNRVLRYYENNGQKVSHYIDVLNDWKAKGYSYGDIVLPHDAKIEDIKSETNVAGVFRNYGYKPVILPRTRDLVGDIEAVRTILPKCYFDKDNTKQGLEALRNYRRKFDAERKVYDNRPFHDWSSHAADAFRYFAQYGAKRNSEETFIDVDTSWIR